LQRCNGTACCINLGTSGACWKRWSHALGGGITPNCIIRPSMSIMMRVSLIRPLQTVDDHAPNPDWFPRRGHPKKCSIMSASPFKSAGDLIAFGNLLFDGKIQIREASSHGAKNILQTVQSGALTGKGTCSTTSSDTNRAAASMSPLLITSSTKQRTTVALDCVN
jgi:hypothetical protein